MTAGSCRHRARALADLKLAAMPLIIMRAYFLRHVCRSRCHSCACKICVGCPSRVFQDKSRACVEILLSPRQICYLLSLQPAVSIRISLIPRLEPRCRLIASASVTVFIYRIAGSIFSKKPFRGSVSKSRPEPRGAQMYMSYTLLA